MVEWNAWELTNMFLCSYQSARQLNMAIVLTVQLQHMTERTDVIEFVSIEEDQEKGHHLGTYYAKLLCAERVLCKGDPQDFRDGTSIINFFCL